MVLLSRSRYLGIGPSVARPGDCLFVLFGLREALVLRPRDDGAYMFVGTAWFYGFMEGRNQSDFEAGVLKRRGLCSDDAK